MLDGGFDTTREGTVLGERAAQCNVCGECGIGRRGLFSNYFGQFSGSLSHCLRSCT